MQQRDVVECDEAGDPELCTGLGTCQAVAPALFNKYGVCLIANALCGEALEEASSKARAHVSEVFQIFSVRQALGQLGEEQYREINCRDGGRYDIRYRMEEEPFSSLGRGGSWMPVVRGILGEETSLLFCGVLLAHGDANEPTDQEWHRDGGHLFDGVHLPCHCLNVFIPLVNLVEENGPTQFVLGSHAMGFRDEGDVSAVTMVCEVGTAILFDYRILHRGTANRSWSDRPCMYFTYSKPWFVDHKNLRSTKSIFSGCATSPNG